VYRISPKWKDSALFLSVFFILFALINSAFYYFLNLSLQVWTFFYSCLLELITFGFAYEATQIILTLFFKEIKLPFVGKLDSYPSVALICTTCDNADINILNNFGLQTYPNLQIFILDDSKNEESKEVVDSLNFHVIRRPHRNGYKGGSLNNWLTLQGDNYPYFVVVDADSVLSDDFVEKMIAYAEHPDNSDVAIFESLISAWNHKNYFAHLLGTLDPLVHQRKLCLDNRFKSTLSVGHNNLYRTSIIKLIGGFKEEYLAEDYATSIEVLRIKSLCMTVPVISFERLPENLLEFVGRQSRWTIQTFQLSNLKVSQLSWYTRLSILMALHYYFMPVAVFFGMVLLAFLNVENWILTRYFLPFDFVSVSMLIKDKILIFWLTYLLFPIFLRGIIAWKIGVSIPRYLKSTLFHSAIFSATIWPILRRLIVFWDNDRFYFNITVKTPYPSIQQIISLNKPVFLLILIALLSVILNPLWNILNLFWIIPGFLSPFLIYYIQRKNHGT
jgi:hypothetical protein